MIFRKEISFLILLLSLGVSQPSLAQDFKRFDEKRGYDIYFRSGENHMSVVEDVSILGFQQIAEKEFLIVKSKGFKLSDDAGYILFDSIIAILPENDFRIRKSDSIQVR
ncbi:MAG: hypothetical protein KBD53_02110 [Candidatus Omnitrophica bacterium]|nr:hypothetical protein [Candidatus Omnitrophota bacterium]